MKINKNFICKFVLDNYILIDIKNDNKVIYKLNESSKFIYDLLVNENSIEEIIEAVKNKYNIDFLTANKDVKEFINELIQLNIINND